MENGHLMPAGLNVIISKATLTLPKALSPQVTEG